MRYDAESQKRFGKAGFQHTHKTFKTTFHCSQRKNKIDHQLPRIMQCHRAAAPRRFDFEVVCKNMCFFGFET